MNNEDQPKQNHITTPTEPAQPQDTIVGHHTPNPPQVEEQDNSLEDRLTALEEVASADEDTDDYKEPEALHKFEAEDWTSEAELEGGNAVHLHLPSDTKDNVIESVNKIPENHATEDKWRASHIGAYYNGTMEQALYSRLGTGNWLPKIQHDGEEIGMSALKTRASNNKVITGRAATYRLMESLGTGRIGMTPLVHTGIWVKFTPPEEGVITDYYRAISKEKASLGRYTYGKIFSNMKILHDDITVKFVLKHVVATSLDIAPTDVKKFLSVIAPEDFPALQWGLAKAMYPEGVEYDVACSVDPLKCNFLYEGKLAVDKLHFMDEANIPKECLDTLIMADTGSVTLRDVDNYKKTLWADQKKKFTIPTLGAGNIEVTLKHSTMDTQIEVGKKWIKACHEDIIKAVDVDADEEERANFVNQKAKISYLCQYEHYVQEVDTGNGVIQGDDITGALIAMSGSDITRDALIDAIEDFIDDSQYAIVGIPKFKCPTCNITPVSRQSNRPAHSHIDAIIPLDVTQVFFTLIGIRMVKITERDL